MSIMSTYECLHACVGDAVLIYVYMYVFLGSMYVCNLMYVDAYISVHVGIRIIYVFTTVFFIWQ